MLVKIKETKKLKTEVLMLGISSGVTQSELFPIEEKPFKCGSNEWERYNYYSVLVEPKDACCEKMTELMVSDCLGFSDTEGKYCFENHKYDSCGDYLRNDEICLKYCPFCGEELKYEIVETTIEQPIIQDYSYKVKEIVKEPVYKDITVTRKKYVGCIEERSG